MILLQLNECVNFRQCCENSASVDFLRMNCSLLLSFYSPFISPHAFIACFVLIRRAKIFIIPRFISRFQQWRNALHRRGNPIRLPLTGDYTTRCKFIWINNYNNFYNKDNIIFREYWNILKDRAVCCVRLGAFSVISTRRPLGNRSNASCFRDHSVFCTHLPIVSWAIIERQDPFDMSRRRRYNCLRFPGCQGGANFIFSHL